MEWTKEFPTVPGHYWWIPEKSDWWIYDKPIPLEIKTDDHDNFIIHLNDSSAPQPEPESMRVVLDRNCLVVWDSNGNIRFAKLNGWWFGPIFPPKFDVQF